MHITIINDCRDENARGRQTARASSLLSSPVSFVGVGSDLEASGNIIDVLDAYGEEPGVIIVNVAPRNGPAKKWENGTPFGYFWYKKVLVVSSIDGLTLSFVKKLKLVDSINVFDIPEVVRFMVENKYISPEVGDHIINTQFRSYDFLPRVAALILQNKDVPFTEYGIDSFSDLPLAVWWVDNFGNCKITLLLSEINIGTDNKVATEIGDLTYYSRLKDVPDKAVALITGSSGLGDNRFSEIVVQGESASVFLGLSSGAEISPVCSR